MGCVEERLGDKNTVRDGRLSPSHSRMKNVGCSMVGNDDSGLSNGDTAWLQSGTMGNEQKTTKNKTGNGTSSSNRNGTMKHTTMGIAIAE